MKYRGKVIKLDLKRAIILEDARRINARRETINNLWRLTIEMTERYEGIYDTEQLYKTLWRAQAKGYSLHGLSKNMKPIIKHLCEVLSVKEKDLITTITN